MRVILWIVGVMMLTGHYQFSTINELAGLLIICFLFKDEDLKDD